MKIDPSKTSFTNLVALVTERNPQAKLNSNNVSFGAASPLTDATGVSNSQITLTATKNLGYSDSVVIKYKRVTFDQAYPSFPNTFAVAAADTAAAVTARITAALGTLTSEFTINSGNAITLPTAVNQSVNVTITAKTTSKIFQPGASKTITLQFTLPIVAVTYSGTGNNLNTLALLNNPTAIADYRLTITGTIGSTSTANPALTVGALPAGSKMTLINAGKIQGCGGVGAAYNAAGLPGGNALKALMDFDVDTAAGFLYAGGGGGGGAGQTFTGGLNWLRAAGGGGSGNAAGAVGTGTAIAGLGLQTNNAATAGSATAGGVGAKVSSMSDATQYSQGGQGGGPGAAGASGVASKGTSTATTASFAGGAAGKAIDLNGKVVTFIAGNNTTQIKGAVA